MRLIVSLLAVTTLTAVACHDATSPQRQQQTIFGIKVTPSAAVTDTIRISFSDGASPCDTEVQVETELLAGGVRFSASSVSPIGACLLPVDAIQLPFIYVVPPPHSTPFTVNFAEPGQPDSVRVVATP
jgi:hypothetical protein